MHFPSDDSSNNKTIRTEVVQGTQNVIDTELQFFSKALTKVDTYMNYTRPALAIAIDPIRKAFLQSKDRGIHLRYLTEITKDNLSYCKELLKMVDELRHLDGIKGNFMVSETEYVAPLILFEHGKVAPQAVYSNISEVVEQQQYLFDNIWNKSIPAEERIKEIEEGILPVKTKILKDENEIINEIRRLNNSASRLSICSAFGGMQMSYKYFFDTYKKIVEDEGMKCIVNINKKDSIGLVKVFLNAGIQVRHVKNMPPMNFGVSDKELAATIEKMEGGKMSQSFLISNDPLYINHFNSIFEELWKNGIDAEDRIRDIEVGAEWADVEVIPMSSRAKDLYLNLVKKAEKEVIIMFPTTNAFIRQKNLGVIQFSEEAARERNVKVRILMPSHKSTEDIVQHLKENYAECIDIRYIEKTSDTKATILVVDRKVSLVMELRDDSKRTFDEAIGLSTYSNSRPGVLSYVSIFENLWKQTELYEQLKIHDRMQQEFINVAAHELRTPIQPIISLTEVLQSQIKDVKQQELLEVTIRNAKRLQRLTNDILDVTKIEGKSLELNKEEFNLNDVLINAMNDITLGRDFLNNENIKLSYNPHWDILIQADKGRISQVISNLLSNAIKFTAEGTILISVEKDKSSNNNNNNKAIIVSVKDSGQGIDSSILPRLFTKFASKSYKGTGLGLFISKGIIEAHGGKIWGENNPDGRGATFSFSLPLEKNQ